MSLLEDFPTDDVPEPRALSTNMIEHIDEPDPILDSWAFYPLYKESQNGGTLVWQIGFSGTQVPSGCLVIKHGFERTSKGTVGEITFDETEVKTNLSGRSLQEQALLEARKRYQDKLKDGYHQGVPEGAAKLPAQLAVPYREGIFKDKHFNRGVSCQVKIDGIRARIWLENAEVKIYSRKGNKFSWLDHIKEEIKELLTLLPGNAGLDCELYNDKMKFEDLTAAVKTKISIHEKNKEVNCYIFDIVVPDMILEDRITMLKKCWDVVSGKQHLFLVPNCIVHMRSSIDHYLDQAIASGYEGVILRKFLGVDRGYTKDKMKEKDINESLYRGNRNNNLIKYKKFKDAEGIIISVKDGKGKEKGAAIFGLKSKDGKIFDCRPEGTLGDRKRWFLNPNECIGKEYTYRYFELTKKGIPRFPVGVGFRDYE